MKRLPWAIPVAALFVVSTASAQGDKEALIEDALSAAPSEIAADATVIDWDGNVLRKGTNEWACYPSHAEGTCPMCVDEPWNKWLAAYANGADFKTSHVGISYML